MSLSFNLTQKTAVLSLLGGLRNVAMVVSGGVVGGAETSGCGTIPLGTPGSLLLIF